MRLEIADIALSDLADIYRYGRRNFGLRQADIYLDGLQQRLALLLEAPMMGRERDEVRPPIRLVPYEAHHIFYDAIGDAVAIQRVLHRSVDWIRVI